MAVKHSLFEVAIDAASIRDALRATDYNLIVGLAYFMTGPVSGDSKISIVGGQKHIKHGKPVLESVENGDHPAIAKTGTIAPFSR